MGRNNQNLNEMSKSNCFPGNHKMRSRYNIVMSAAARNQVCLLALTLRRIRTPAVPISTKEIATKYFFCKSIPKTRITRSYNKCTVADWVLIIGLKNSHFFATALILKACFNLKT